MQTRSQTRQPVQPPKEAAYTQASNPVSQTPSEQRAPPPTRQYGDPTPSITRGPSSNPSNDEALARLQEQHRQEQEQMQKSPDVDLEYGVEQQPAEGYIADTVARKGMGMQRAQDGAHAGPVGSAAGPGHPGFGEERDLAANMEQKKAEHERMLGEKVGRSPAGPDAEVVEREAVRERKLKRNEEVEGVLKESSETPVVG
ncbi:hypothetical protein PMG11_06333 [Penicillium brasilianum]|uniref:Uncharacterized protein n=1 Tax=Penicillium brasilianum TaxID=104259 RepID=A0A0F7TRL0_PENBI|nr:hypothetical protein PMG11_06333 [Penicillium brasilianum]